MVFLFRTSTPPNDNEVKKISNDPSLAIIEGTVTRVNRWRESTLSDRSLEFDIVIEYIMKHSIDPNDIGLEKDELELFQTSIHKEKIKSKITSLLQDVMEENEKKFFGFDFRNKINMKAKIEQIKKLINESGLTYEECNIDLDTVAKLSEE
jgi:arsenate reductase-like glutaredoxin family protein